MPVSFYVEMEKSKNDEPGESGIPKRKSRPVEARPLSIGHTLLQ